MLIFSAITQLICQGRPVSSELACAFLILGKRPGCAKAADYAYVIVQIPRVLPKFFSCSEQRLQKEHDFKVTKLKMWQKDLEARLAQVMEEVKEFQKKERMTEAQKYVDILDEIQSKIHGFMEEVNVFAHFAFFYNLFWLHLIVVFDCNRKNKTFG